MRLDSSHILLGIASLSVGILIGYLSTQYSYFDIDYQIDLVAVSSVLTTIIIGLYISGILQKRQAANRVEKELLISKVNTILHHTSHLTFEDNMSQFKLTFATGIFKSMNIELKDIGDCIGLCELNVSSSLIDKLKGLILKLKQEVTNTMSRNGQFIYDDAQLSQISLIKSEIRKNMFEIIVEINRA